MKVSFVLSVENLELVDRLVQQTGALHRGEVFATAIALYGFAVHEAARGRAIIAIDERKPEDYTVLDIKNAPRNSISGRYANAEIEMDEEGEKQMNAIMKKAEAASYPEVLENALAVYALAIKYLEKGKSVASLDMDTMKYARVAFPEYLGAIIERAKVGAQATSILNRIKNESRSGPSGQDGQVR